MSEQILKDLSLFSPEIALTITLLAGIVADLIFRRTSAVVSAVVMAGLLVTGILVLGQSGLHASIFGNMLAVDPFAFLI